MYTNIRSIEGGTLMTCSDCGHAISMNKICTKPLQSATDMLKHMAAHNVSRAFPAPLLRPARPLRVPPPSRPSRASGVQPTALPVECGTVVFSLDQLKLSKALFGFSLHSEEECDEL
jgi:hypothetical protein